ncbi:retrovirus-related pol polyprotein from transposon TNT 1-94 [Tanacetum coccineum]
MLTKPQAFYDNIHKQALGYQNPFYLKKAQRIKPTLYDGIVMSAKYVAMPVSDNEEILILKEEGAQLSAEEAFWLRMSNPTSKPSDASPIKIEAPKELPKEQADILRGIVEQAKAKQHLDKELDFACSSKKAKSIESKNANHSEPNHPWGPNATDIPSSSSLVMTGCPDCSLLNSVKTAINFAKVYRNGVVERRNRTLVEAARTMLIFSKASLFLWVEAINTASYTKNRSLICLRYNKTLYELMQDKKLDLLFFHVFGALCYPTNENDDLGKLDAKPDIGNGFLEYSVQDPRLHSDDSCNIPGQDRSNTISQQPCIPPNKDDWDHLFQPMFDKYFTLPSIVVSPVQEAVASKSCGFEELPKIPTFCNDPLHESLHEDSTSQGSSSNVRQTHTPFEHLGKWTKDHLIANMISHLRNPRWVLGVIAP